jgi:hypothetical protein
VRVSGDLSFVDTLMLFGDTEKIVVDAPWGPWPVPPPHAKETRITHEGYPPRICVGDQEGPEIVCFGPAGDRASLRWVSEPAPLTQPEVDAWREEMVQLFGGKLSRDQTQEILDQVPFPGERPAYSGIFLDHAGYLWAERGPTAEGSPGSTDYLVFEPDGVLLGVVALPLMEVLEIGRDYVIGVHRDDLEIQYVRVHALRKPMNGTGQTRLQGIR